VSRSGPVERIGLFGPWGYGNLGCAATVDATIQNIRVYRPNAELVCFSLFPADTEQRHGVRSYRLGTGGWEDEVQRPELASMRLAGWLQSRRSSVVRRAGRLLRRLRMEVGMVPQTYRRLKPLDLLIVTGGGQLLDFWGSALSHPWWLLKYAVLSRLAGTRLVFLSVGAGPVDSRLSRVFCRGALWLSSYRSYRDEASKEFVKARLKFRRDDPVYPDLAYSLHTRQQPPASGNRRVVGLGVMTYNDPRHWPDKDVSVYRGYLERHAAFVRWLVERGYRVSLLVGESRADRDTIGDLVPILERCFDLDSEDAPVRNESILTVEELLGQIDRTDLVVASRLHNVLLATLRYKPVIALSYHPKIDSLMEEAGQARYCLPIHEFDLDLLKARFQELEHDSAAIRRHFARLVAARRVALEEQYERVLQGV
jgi:polysaccharide pyruvyl transferase WcaK-like protein